MLLAIGLGALRSLGSCRRRRSPRRTTRRSRRATNGRSPAPSASSTRAQLQRGFKVYKEVCQTCHGLNLLSFRNLADPGGPGFTAAQATAIAAEYKVKDGPNDQGEMFERNGRLADRFPPPSTWKNEAQARTLYNGTVPPDMSVLAKARGYERGFPWFLIDALPFFAVSGARRRLRRGAAQGLQGQAAGRLHSSRPAATTTNTSPATRSRCRRR